MSALVLIALALAGLCALFAALYLVARRYDNYGVVDVAWAYAFGLLALFYAATASGWPVRRALIASLALIWSLRLGTHLAIRVIGHHPVEDGRYLQLRKDWAANFVSKMFWFFQMQAASVVLLGAAFIVAALNPAPSLHPLCSGSSPSAAKPWPTPNSPPSSGTPPTGAKSAPSASGAPAGTPTTFSNGSFGSGFSFSPSAHLGAGSQFSAP